MPLRSATTCCSGSLPPAVPMRTGTESPGDGDDVPNCRDVFAPQQSAPPAAMPHEWKSPTLIDVNDAIARTGSDVVVSAAPPKPGGTHIARSANVPGRE